MQLCDADLNVYVDKFYILRNLDEYLETFAHNQF